MTSLLDVTSRHLKDEVLLEVERLQGMNVLRKTSMCKFFIPIRLDNRQYADGWKIEDLAWMIFYVFTTMYLASHMP